MKTSLVFILFITVSMQLCFAQKSNTQSVTTKFNETVDTSILSFYCQYSSFTNPGEYEYLYENLPDSLTALCSLIKSQFIHPYAELQKYKEQIPKERWREMFHYSSVKSILEGLHNYDSLGIVKNRAPEHRLILGCQQNAILLASIMKYRGIPARVRSGHANYIMHGFHISHTVCEVWNKNEMRWMLVDPSMNLVDFGRDKFDFSNELWLKFQNQEIDPNLYGIPRRYTGLVSILGKVCTDLASILGTEYPINQFAPILESTFDENSQLSTEQIETLNKICELMKSINSESFSKLQEIYNSNPEIQITKSFEHTSKNSNSSRKLEDN